MVFQEVTANLLPEIGVIIDAGGDVYVVGGSVRDELLGKEPKDIDLLVTGFEYDNLLTLLRKYGKVKEVGKSFGIIKYNKSGIEYDIALPRLEKSIGEGHRDFEITSSPYISVEDDLKRRDFTINSIAYSFKTGEYIDPYNGMTDIENEVIRLVNDNAFLEDPLRILRAVQFAIRFDFNIDADTLASMKANIGLLKTLSEERILGEFDKIFKYRCSIYRTTTLLEKIGFYDLFSRCDDPNLNGNNYFKSRALFYMCITPDFGKFKLTKEDQFVFDKYNEILEISKGGLNLETLKRLYEVTNKWNDKYVSALDTVLFDLPGCHCSIWAFRLLNKLPKTAKDAGIEIPSELKGKEIGDYVSKELDNIWRSELDKCYLNEVNFIKRELEYIIGKKIIDKVFNGIFDIKVIAYNNSEITIQLLQYGVVDAEYTFENGWACEDRIKLINILLKRYNKSFTLWLMIRCKILNYHLKNIFENIFL